MSKAKPIAMVIHRKLGKERAYGQAFNEENIVEIDSRLSGYKYLLIYIHEHLHIIHPDWSETQVKKHASKYARFIWQGGFRKVDIK